MRKKCIECNKRPSFNVKGETKPLYCFDHRLVDMINVITKTCIYDGCTTQSCYNFAGEKLGIYCGKHKLVDMIDVKSKTCIYDGCGTHPYYNFAGEKSGIYCVTHRLVDMINVKSKSCKSEWCTTIPRTKKYDGYCLFCYINLFPDKTVSRNYKTKEYSVVEFVKTKFPHFDFIADKIIPMDKALDF